MKMQQEHIERKEQIEIEQNKMNAMLLKVEDLESLNYFFIFFFFF